MEQKQLLNTARLTGIWYLLLAISGIFGFMVFHPKIFVGDDPQKTLNNLIEFSTVSRIRLLFELVIIVSQALAAVWFYKLFVGINKWAATTLGIWGTVNSIIIMVSAVAMYSVIELAASSSISSEDKLVMVQILTQIISNSWGIGGLFFGLWLLPMGYIIVSSKRMPVALGWVLIVGGVGYLLQTFLNAGGLHSSYIGLLTIPATIGEFWIVGYLLIVGIRPGKNVEM